MLKTPDPDSATQTLARLAKTKRPDGLLTAKEVELLRRSQREIDEDLKASGFDERMDKVKVLWKAGKAKPTDTIASLLAYQETSKPENQLDG